MKQAPPWSEREFELLLVNNDLSNEELAARLGSRTAGAVNWVRSGIHSYHRGGDVSMLSAMMLRRLERETGVICPVCGQPVGKA